MFIVDENTIIGKGSNSKVYRCIFNDNEYVAKIPHDPNRFISSGLQVDAMNICNKECHTFILPKVIYYKNNDPRWGEILVMEKLNKIFPIDFLLRKGMVDREYVIVNIAKAIAELHSIGISGFDVEFFWSFDYGKIALLDLGPRYTIGYTGVEMIKKHYELLKENNNKMALWNIVSELLDENRARNLFSKIICDNYLPDVCDLIESLDDISEQKHIKGVAYNHYLQLLGECPDYIKEQYVKLFIKKYIKESNCIDYLYVKSFSEAYQNRITNSTSYLYLSKYKSLSKMSNSVNIS